MVIPIKQILATNGGGLSSVSIYVAAMVTHPQLQYYYNVPAQGYMKKDQYGMLLGVQPRRIYLDNHASAPFNVALPFVRSPITVSDVLNYGLVSPVGSLVNDQNLATI